jgi:hypothetical protein
MTIFLTSLVIVVCFTIGGYFQFFSDKIDAPAEQMAEEVLAKEGIVEDFSSDKKKKLADKVAQDSAVNNVASDNGSVNK